MSAVDIFISSQDVPLASSPINPSWILEGTPQARVNILSVSRDGLAVIAVWDCTNGSFNWFYDMDETVHVIEGGVTLTDAAGTREVHAGDVVFFPAGSHAKWVVTDYIRKVAFLRQPVPQPVSLGIRALRKARRMLNPGQASTIQAGGPQLTAAA